MTLQSTSLNIPPKTLPAKVTDIVPFTTKDGTTLRLDVFIPRTSNPNEKFPVVLRKTVYCNPSWIERSYNKSGVFYNQGPRPYIYVLAYARGRCGSEGYYEPDVSRDNYELVEQVAKLPQSDGRVVMEGISIHGFEAWATLKNNPPSLVAIAANGAPFPGVDYPFRGSNIFMPDAARWLALTRGKVDDETIYGDDYGYSKLWTGIYQYYLKGEIPFRELDTLAGFPNYYFQQWVSHPTFDSFWKEHTPTCQDYEKSKAAVLNITGQYDSDQLGSLTYHRMYTQCASEESQKKYRLLITPWFHGGKAAEDLTIEGQAVDSSAALNLQKLQREWFDCQLKREKNCPDLLKDPVTYHVIGEKGWHGSESLEKIPTRYETYQIQLPFHLPSEPNVCSELNSHDLSRYLHPQFYFETPLQRSFDYYIYDPIKTKFPFEKCSSLPESDQLSCSFDLLFEQNSALVYDTPPFKTTEVMAGFVTFSAKLDLGGVSDTDLEVGLFKVIPDPKNTHQEKQFYLGSSVIRARYRNSTEREELIKRSGPEPYRFQLNFIANRIKKGERLRLILGHSVYDGGELIQKNYNNARPVEMHTAKEAQTAYVTLLQGELRLPLSNL